MFKNFVACFLDFYYNKWTPRFFYKKPDGGKESGVTGYFLIEWKKVLSIGILHFKEGSREAYHNHAFDAITWWLWGSVVEEIYPSGCRKSFKPSFAPKVTRRNCFHKVIAHEGSYALTFRGPWSDTWLEYRPDVNKEIVLTHGRKLVDARSV